MTTPTTQVQTRQILASGYASALIEMGIPAKIAFDRAESYSEGLLISQVSEIMNTEPGRFPGSYTITAIFRDGSVKRTASEVATTIYWGGYNHGRVVAFYWLKNRLKKFSDEPGVSSVWADIHEEFDRTVRVDREEGGSFLDCWQRAAGATDEQMEQIATELADMLPEPSATTTVAQQLAAILPGFNLQHGHFELDPSQHDTSDGRTVLALIGPAACFDTCLGVWRWVPDADPDSCTGGDDVDMATAVAEQLKRVGGR